jgi:hypothetical protein
MIENENLRNVNQPFFDVFRCVFNESRESGWYVLGENAECFEVELATYCVVAHCAWVCYGLDA